MTDILLFVILALLIIAAVLLLVVLRRSFQTDPASLVSRLDAFEKSQGHIERTLREELASGRDETGKAAREQRQELASGARQLREEVVATLKGISETMARTMGELANLQKTQLEAMSTTIGKLSDSNEKKLEALRVTVEGKLQSMQADNARQLEQMRQTVDEKLQGTLEKRLGESFKQVSERLELVHKGLGRDADPGHRCGRPEEGAHQCQDPRHLGRGAARGACWSRCSTPISLPPMWPPRMAASGSNLRSNCRGRATDGDEIVWLPIDAKFPIEDYQRLIDAQELGDLDGVEAAGKAAGEPGQGLRRETSASKYLNPPKTTDFAILFLPIEGLFAEVIRRTGLTEAIQRECRVVIAGPTTLWSILNSLQMGFRTLAIQKRSSEVWNLLAAVKTEWTKYGDVLDAVQKKLHQASDTIEKAKVRSRAVGRKLKDVQELPAGEAAAVLSLDAPEVDEAAGKNK